MLLAIDTSTDTASLALAQDKTVLAELTWRSKQNHTTQLLPNLNYLFGITGTEAKSLTGIIIAQGPGSFNGLRVGVRPTLATFGLVGHENGHEKAKSVILKVHITTID